MMPFWWNQDCPRGVGAGLIIQGGGVEGPEAGEHIDSWL